ncbi:MAG: PocR ligand-binding domain-containing protein [Tenericutes bacterium]|nr:PocR ligand-binding domain-containing protein [Mycoplasmatota bacterium]
MKPNVINFIDFNRVNTLLEGFNKSTGFVTAILDLEGNVLSKSGWRSICTNFHRVNPKTNRNCIISDTKLSTTKKDNDYNIYKCHNGLYDVSVPIMIDDEHIANLFTGQFFFEEPNISFFQEQAKKYGFEEQSYIKALKEVPIVTESQVKDIIKYLLNITHIIIDLTIDKIEQENSRILLESSLESPIDILILAIDKDYNYLYFNQTHKASMKISYNADVEVGKCIFDYMTSKDDILRIKENYDKALSGVSHTTLEQYGNLDVRPYETVFNPIKDKNENIIGVTAYARDVSKRIRSEKALEKSKNLAQEYLDIAGVMIIVLDKNGVVTLINKKGCEIIGLNESDIVGKNWFDNYLPKDVVQSSKEQFDNMWKNDHPFAKEYESTILNAHGEERYISWHNSILYDSNKNIIGVLSSGEDITEISITNEKLKESEKRYRELINNTKAGIMIHASDTSIMSFNKRAQKLLGLTSDELTGKTAASSNFHFVNSDYNKIKYEDYPVNIIIQNRSTLKNYILGIKHIHDDKVIWVSVNGVPLFNDDGSIKEIVISFIDISDEKIKQDEITYLSNHDFLTDLYNRRFFVEKYSELDKLTYYPLAIMMADVNGLKIINDAFGHDVGDIALQKVAQILEKSCRKQDIVCRIGGDEFAIILPNITEEELEKINESIRIESKKDNVENVTLSLATGHEIKIPGSKESLDEILKAAENHMYRHKLSEGVSIRNNAIKAILKTLTNKYQEERIHSAKVSQLCKRIGEELELKEEEIKELELAGMYHDIGKISIPDAILNKPGKLTQEEYNIIKTHSEISYQILRAADEYSDLAIHALYHHERWDGLGYPSRKKGEDIPLFSRIICIVDAFEAMTAERVYKEKMSEEAAVKEIIRCSGTQFDERLARIFVEKVLMKEWIIS